MSDVIIRDADATSIGQAVTNGTSTTFESCWDRYEFGPSGWEQYIDSVRHTPIVTIAIDDLVCGVEIMREPVELILGLWSLRLYMMSQRKPDEIAGVLDRYIDKSFGSRENVDSTFSDSTLDHEVSIPVSVKKDVGSTKPTAQIDKFITDLESGTSLQFSDELRSMASRAVDSTKQRRAESIDEWASRLAQDAKDFND